MTATAPVRAESPPSGERPASTARSAPSVAAWRSPGDTPTAACAARTRSWTGSCSIRTVPPNAGGIARAAPTTATEPGGTDSFRSTRPGSSWLASRRTDAVIPTSSGEPSCSRVTFESARSRASTVQRQGAASPGGVSGAASAGGASVLRRRRSGRTSAPPWRSTTTDAPATSTAATRARCAARSIGSTRTARRSTASAACGTSGTRTATFRSRTMPPSSFRVAGAIAWSIEASSSPASSLQPIPGM